MRQQHFHKATGVLRAARGLASRPARHGSGLAGRRRRHSLAEPLNDRVVEHLVASVERFHDHLLGETSLALAALADAAPCGSAPASGSAGLPAAGGWEEQLAPA